MQIQPREGQDERRLQYDEDHGEGDVGDEHRVDALGAGIDAAEGDGLLDEVDQRADAEHKCPEAEPKSAVALLTTRCVSCEISRNTRLE